MSSSVYLQNIEMIDQEAEQLGITRSTLIGKCVEDYFEQKKQASQHKYVNDKKTLALGLLLAAILTLQLLLIFRMT